MLASGRVQIEVFWSSMCPSMASPRDLAVFVAL